MSSEPQGYWVDENILQFSKMLVTTELNSECKVNKVIFYLYDQWEFVYVILHPQLYVTASRKVLLSKISNHLFLGFPTDLRPIFQYKTICYMCQTVCVRLIFNNFQTCSVSLEMCNIFSLISYLKPLVLCNLT